MLSRNSWPGFAFGQFRMRAAKVPNGELGEAVQFGPSALADHAQHSRQAFGAVLDCFLPCQGNLL